MQEAINTINQTYEIDTDLEAYNYRGHILLTELKEQIERYACSGAVWTQTTDVEGEVNGCKSQPFSFHIFLIAPVGAQRTDLVIL